MEREEKLSDQKVNFRRSLDGRKARIGEKSDMESLQKALWSLRVRYGLYKQLENKPEIFSQRDIMAFARGAASCLGPLMR